MAHVSGSSDIRTKHNTKWLYMYNYHIYTWVAFCHGLHCNWDVCFSFILDLNNVSVYKKI